MIRRSAAGQGKAAVLWTAIAVALFSPMAQAALGGTAATIADDERRVRGVRGPSMSLPAMMAVQVHVITMSDGSSIREFVGRDGIVFGVSWSTRFKPDLASLLGAHAADYTGAASEAARVPGIKRHAVIERGDLVVHATAHLNAFVGRAYLRSRVPNGLRADELR